jgi:TatD DNase family protein
MFVDTHTHLQLSDFDSDRAMVIGNAKKADVRLMIVPGVDSRTSHDAVHWATLHEGVIFAAVGFHPYEAQQHIDLTLLETLIADHPKKIVAIGECGLDYHLYKGEAATSKKNNQKELFRAQLAIANKHNLPVIMHCRDAFEDFFDVIDSVGPISGVIHCFSGGLQEVRIAQQKGLYVGVDGNVTYSKPLSATVTNIPLSMLMLETDAPYLTPIPHRGTRNEPKYIPLIANHIAQLQTITPNQVEQQTTINAQKLFAI